jgi:hypothetical protein
MMKKISQNSGHVSALHAMVDLPTRERLDMDPNEALVIIRDTIESWEDWGGGAEELLQTISDTFTALDDFLTNGGLLPSDWVN